MNAAQAPKCSMKRKNVLIQECWSIPDGSMTDYEEVGITNFVNNYYFMINNYCSVQAYDYKKDACENLEISNTHYGRLDGLYLRSAGRRKL